MQFLEFSARELFEIRQGSSRYTREYVRQHPGDYPVYSATTAPGEYYGTIDTYDFEGETLTWVRSGYAGQVVLRSGAFSVNGDAGVLLPVDSHKPHLYLPYFVPVLTNVFTRLAVGRYKANGTSDYTKVSLGKLRAARVLVPVTPDGLPDLDAQYQIASRYERVQRAKRDLERIQSEIEQTRLMVAMGSGPIKSFDIADLFEITKGDGNLTQQYIRLHPGSFPVYSGSSFRDAVAGYIDTYDFDGDYLTWAADGYAGAVYYRSGKFSANSHAGILSPRAELKNQLHLPFFEHALTPVFEAAAVGRFKPNGAPDYTRLTVSMAKSASVMLPVNDAGAPDIHRQEVAADRMGELLKLKEELIFDMQALLHVDVEIAGLPLR